MREQLRRLQAVTLQWYSRHNSSKVERWTVTLFVLMIALALLSLVPGTFGQLCDGSAVLAGLVMIVLLLVLAFRHVSGLRLWTVTLFLFTVLLLLLSLLPGDVGQLYGTVALFAVMPLTILLFVLAFQYVTGRLLWTVRNRLIATCLLMGLAPVVLFGLLIGIAAYIFSGQFATNTARAAIDRMMSRVHTGGTGAADPLLHQIGHFPTAAQLQLPVISLGRDLGESSASVAIAAWDGTRRIPLATPAKENDLEVAPFVEGPPPVWLHSGFRGIVELGGKLYLCSTNSAGDENHLLLVVATALLDNANLSQMAEGLGSITILPPNPKNGSASPSVQIARKMEGRVAPPKFRRLQGGTLPEPTHFFDTPVYFGAPLHVTEWTTGQDLAGNLGVASRPGLLYARLFAGSLYVGIKVRDVLVVIAVVFSLLELLAFTMAVRLSRTITASIAGLYNATTEIDHGNFGHRIRVVRHDQLASLETSFNAMAGSLGHLLEQQREKERLLSELEIAQEVQNNLFPHTPIHMPGFELHGVCKPARTVSGDYYDFIPDGEDKLCLALGDISGKGISAALLMASLHSAVRAFRFAGEVFEPQPSQGADGFASPANMLCLLNKHLYRSTQQAKYATLFLACYDAPSRELTYSNGGQLPPLLLCADGSVKRLECGGTVVGLLDEQAYEQGMVRMDSGDILIAYSDGVTEPENEFGDFGEERLLALVRQHRHQPLAAISSQAMRALRSWIGEREQPDDITLVLARQL